MTIKQISPISDGTTSTDQKDPDLGGFKLTGHNLLVRPVHTEGKTAGGIILADKTKDDVAFLMNVCKVLQIGPTAYTQTMFEKSGPWCKEGDFIMIPKISGTKLDFKGVPLTIVACDKVIAVIDNPKDIDPNFNISTNGE